MPLSCHVFRVSSIGRSVLLKFLEESSKKRVYKVKLRVLGNKEFNIGFSKIVSSIEGLHFYKMEYPERVEFIDYETEKLVARYRKESTQIVYITVNNDYAFVFLCGGNVVRAKNIIEEIVRPFTRGDYALLPFSISPAELEYLINEYDFSVKYARHDKTETTNLDRVAMWGSNVTENPFYRQLKGMSRDPNREIRIGDSLYSFKGIGTIGITRKHEKTNTLALRVWSNVNTDVLAKYLLDRIIEPIIKKRSEGVS